MYMAKDRLEYDKKIIGENLRQCRIAGNFSVEEVRQYLQIGSLQAIYKWEEGRCYPQADNLLALMELYKVGWEELVYGKDKNTAKILTGFWYYIFSANDYIICWENQKIIIFLTKPQCQKFYNRVKKYCFSG